MTSLSLLDVLVKELQFVREVGSHFSILIEAVVNQLLEQSLLHTLVLTEAVDEPREERAGGCETRPRSHHKGPNHTRLWQLLALVVSGTNSVIL